MNLEEDLLRDVMLLSRSTQLVLQDEVLESLKEPALGPTKVNLLRILRRSKKQSVNDLARFLGQTKAAASQNIDSLVKAGMVRRDSDKVDRRCVWVSLTPRGSRVLSKAENRQLQALKKAIANLPKATLKKTTVEMRALANAILSSSSSKSENCLQCCAYTQAGCVYDEGDWSCQYKKSEKKHSKGKPKTGAKTAAKAAD